MYFKDSCMSKLIANQENTQPSLGPGLGTYIDASGLYECGVFLIEVCLWNLVGTEMNHSLICTLVFSHSELLCEC